MAEENEKVFTQAELDEIIGKRLNEERKKFPSAEEMAGYTAWKNSQQTDADKIAAITGERDSANSALAEANKEVERLKHERFLLSKGVSADDLEYYDFKISKAVSDEKTYEAAADEFIQERQTVRVDMGVNLGGGGNQPKSTNAMMNDLLRRSAKK